MDNTLQFIEITVSENIYLCIKKKKKKYVIHQHF